MGDGSELESAAEERASPFTADLAAIGEALARLARGEDTDLSPFVTDLCVSADLGACKGEFHCHVVALDGNGRVRVSDLIRHLSNSLIDYAIPRSQIKEAYAVYEHTGSSTRLNQLANEARELFATVAKSGEGGELLLFLFAEQVLKLPQLLCKMDLKTHPNVHFHGSDGLHAGVGSNGRLALYWSESKIHKTFSGAITKCFASLAKLLTNPAAWESRDLQLLSRYMDLNDSALEGALRTYLDPSNENFNAVEFRGLCLVGFDSPHYPLEPNKMTIDHLRALISSEIGGWREVAIKQAEATGISSYAFHLFCLPLPSVEDFRAEFQKMLGPPHVAT